MKSRKITAQELFFTYTSDRFIQGIYYIIHLWRFTPPRLHSPSLGQHSQRDEWCKMTVSCLSLPSSNPAGLTSHLNQWLSINQAHQWHTSDTSIHLHFLRFHTLIWKKHSSLARSLSRITFQQDKTGAWVWHGLLLWKSSGIASSYSLVIPFAHDPYQE